MEGMKEKTLSLIDRRSTYKLIIPDLVQKKIREWCYHFPTREWSGTLFYAVEGSFEDGSLTLICKDIFISDIGSGTYTEFDYKADIVTYQAEKDLLDCFTGLIHSHNQMATFFSGTDRNTLIEQGMQMPHFLSLIVNNEGVYTAKITRRVNILVTQITYPTFGGENKSENAQTTLSEFLEAFSLDIEIQEDTSIKDEVTQRINEIIKEKASRGSSFQKYAKEFGEEVSPKKNLLVQQFPPYKKEDAQPTLFKKEEVEDESWINVEVPQDLAQRLLVQLVTGSITTGYSDKFDIDKWCSSLMKKAFDRRFPKIEDLDYWIDIYVEFLVETTIWKEVEDVDGEIVVKAISTRLLEMCEELPDNDVLDKIKSKLEEILL